MCVGIKCEGACCAVLTGREYGWFGKRYFGNERYDWVDRWILYMLTFTMTRLGTFSLAC